MSLPLISLPRPHDFVSFPVPHGLLLSVLVLLSLCGGVEGVTGVHALHLGRSPALPSSQHRLSRSSKHQWQAALMADPAWNMDPTNLLQTFSRKEMPPNKETPREWKSDGMCVDSSGSFTKQNEWSWRQRKQTKGAEQWQVAQLADCAVKQEDKSMQQWHYDKFSKELRQEGQCLTYAASCLCLKLAECLPNGPVSTQQWYYDQPTKAVKQETTNLCIETPTPPVMEGALGRRKGNAKFASKPKGGRLMLNKCDHNKKTQQFTSEMFQDQMRYAKKPQDERYCGDPLGLGVGPFQSIPDRDFTASSIKGVGKEAWRSRLNQKGWPWCAAQNNTNQYVQVDLGETKKITAIATQGNYEIDFWVKKYAVRYSEDGKRWKDWKSGTQKEGNIDRDGIKKWSFVPRILQARYVRLEPKSWQNTICVRWELYGCPMRRGDTGDWGDTGPMGDVGQQGLEGAKGERGEVGLKGEAGLKGDRGITGEQGILGARGPKGSKGAQGKPGMTGPQGLPGDRGVPGAKGLQGDKADPGADGPPGDVGLQGEAGNPGEQGDPGPEGPRGKQGERGKNGKDGPRGDTGDTGDAGQPGQAGRRGPAGGRGDPGPKGVDGQNGLAGLKGDPGDDGDVEDGGDDGNRLRLAQIQASVETLNRELDKLLAHIPHVGNVPLDEAETQGQKLAAVASMQRHVWHLKQQMKKEKVLLFKQRDDLRARNDQLAYDAQHSALRAIEMESDEAAKASMDAAKTTALRQAAEQQMLDDKAKGKPTDSLLGGLPPFPPLPTDPPLHAAVARPHDAPFVNPLTRIASQLAKHAPPQSPPPPLSQWDLPVVPELPGEGQATVPMPWTKSSAKPKSSFFARGNTAMLRDADHERQAPQQNIRKLFPLPGSSLSSPPLASEVEVGSTPSSLTTSLSALPPFPDMPASLSSGDVYATLLAKVHMFQQG